jgi:hypothetical protein
MPLILGANSLTGGGYEVDNSLRFNFGSSDYLNRTLTTPTNRKKWTLSMWVKRSNISSASTSYLLSVNSSQAYIYFNTDDTFNIEEYSGGYQYRLKTNRLFRDTSAWYHLVIRFDSTNATADDRVRIYINGVQETSFSARTNPSINFDGAINNNNAHFIGRDASSYWSGYMAETHFIDGQQLAPTDFGEFDEDSGIWKPIAYEGTYGTNGFYLEFKDSSALGDDTSGEGNDFTVNNLTSIDQTTDTPTNNFATFNPLANYITAGTLAEGNLKVTLSTNKAGVPATIGVDTGKWYWENKIDTLPTDQRFTMGICPFEPVEAQEFFSSNNKGIGLNGFNSVIYASGSVIDNFYGNATGRFSGFTGIIGIALDLSSGTKTIAMSKDGAWITGSNTTDTDFANALKVDITSYVNAYSFWHPIIGSGNGSGVFQINFGNPPFTISSGNSDANGYGNFEYAVPSGYYALCTKNLAEYG